MILMSEILIDRVMSEEFKKYDKRGNLIYYRNSDTYESWAEFDDNNNELSFKNSNNYGYWCKYDENNNLIHYKNTYGFEFWYKYDENNKQIDITEKEFKQIERIKLYLNNKKINKFELIDI